MSKLKTCKTYARFLPLLLCFLLTPAAVFADPKDQGDETVYPVPPPLVYQGLYPCQACHRKSGPGVSNDAQKGISFLGKFLRTPDPRPRILVQMHKDINLQHAEWQWCLTCHNTEERNYLRLITGETIPFEQSYRLCGQCHGHIYNDWKLGIHGRRVGQWDGKKLYLLCAHCHDPHSPKYRKLMAQDPPRPPSHGRWGDDDQLMNSHIK